MILSPHSSTSSPYYTSLIRLSCETDFVARTADFIGLGKQIAAVIPSVIKKLGGKNDDLVNKVVETNTEEGKLSEVIENVAAKVGERMLIENVQIV